MTIDDRPPPPPLGPGHPAPQPASRPQPAAPPRGRPALPSGGRRLGRRGGVPVSSTPEGLPTRRRWGRFAAGAMLALLGAWVFAILYVSAGQRVEVLVLSHDVDSYKQLEKGDFRKVRVAADPGVEKVKASKLDDIVGRFAAVPMKEGSLLSDTELVPKDQEESIVADDEQKAYLRMDDGSVPDDTFATIYIRPASTTSGEKPEKIPGCRILYKSEPGENDRKVNVVIIIPEDKADELAAAKVEQLMILGDGD